jgi:hypothetical protein
MATRWLGNTPRIAEQHYLITSEPTSTKPLESKLELRKKAVQNAVQLPVQHDPAAVRTKQKPAGTYANSCGAVRDCSDSQGGESGIRTRGTLRYTSLAMMRIRPLCHLSGSYDRAAEYSRTTDERKSRH